MQISDLFSLVGCFVSDLGLCEKRREIKPLPLASFVIYYLFLVHIVKAFDEMWD
jgi:hypothetical protein